MRRIQQFVSIALCALLAAPVWAQNSDLGPARVVGGFFGQYGAPAIPDARLGNSRRIHALIRGGKLYLTVQDAIALAIENNIDIESDRYNALIDVWAYIRQQAGGPLPGVPSGSSSVGSVQSGEGVGGSQAAAGVSTGGIPRIGSSGTNATVSQIGPITPTLDPSFQSSTLFSHVSSPQYNATQSQVWNLVNGTRNFNEALNFGLITGGNGSLSYSDSYLNQNAPTNTLNPESGVALSLNVQHSLLNGFGKAVNARNITIAKATIGINDLTFKTQVIAIVVSTLNAYYALVADYQDVKAKREALDVARRFYEDNKKQVEIGTMAPLDVTTAEAQVATSEQDFVVSETTLEQDEATFKNLISRNGLADRELAGAEVIPLDHIVVPEEETLPGFKDALAVAMANRADLEVDRLNLVNSETSTIGTNNAILPQLIAIGSVSTQGLSGSPQAVYQGTAQQFGLSPGQPLPSGLSYCPSSFPAGGICETPNPSFVGGIGKALGQMIRRDFPTESGALYFSPTLRNRQAVADQGIDQLSLRQTELENRRTVNQVAVDVSNGLIGLQQARIRYQAAVKNTVLEQQLLEAEQKKFALGSSTTYNVVTQERDLATAQATEIAALATYSQARVSLDQTLGLTLKNNNVSMDEATTGKVNRAAVPPALPPDAR